MESGERKEFALLLSQQLELYDTMRGILSKQSQALESGETEKLLKMMEDVNGFRLQAAELQRAIEPLKKKWESDREEIPEDERQMLMERVEEIRRVLSGVLEAMNHLHGNVHEKKDDTKQKLVDLRRAEVARNGYGQFGGLSRDSRFMDRKE